MGQEPHVETGVVSHHHGAVDCRDHVADDLIETRRIRNVAGLYPVNMCRTNIPSGVDQRGVFRNHTVAAVYSNNGDFDDPVVLRR